MVFVQGISTMLKNNKKHARYKNMKQNGRQINQILDLHFTTRDVACETITLQLATDPLSLASHKTEWIHMNIHTLTVYNSTSLRKHFTSVAK